MNIRSWFLRTTYWINDSLKGSPIGSHYKDIKTILNNPELGQMRRRQYLDSLLKHAVSSTEFYAQYNPNELQSFPVVNKSILLKNSDKIKVEDDKIPGQEGKVLIRTTSGSTGTPFSIPHDTRKQRRRIAELKYFGEVNGFKSHDKLVQLRPWNKWQSKPKGQAMRENIIPFDITRIDENGLEKLTNIIKKNHALAVRAYASSIDLLVRYAFSKNIKLPSLKLMIAGSEALQDSTRELVEGHLGCHIISQYANEENGILAQESILDKDETVFYPNHASYIFEILKLDEDQPAEFGELGRIVLTDLFNYAFPMIRYDTGDTAIMEKRDDKNFNYPVIPKLFGRRVDLVYDTKGIVVFPLALARILKHYNQILQFQFIQEDQNLYTLKLITKNTFNREQEVVSQLEEILGDDAHIGVEYINDIPVLDSGKRKPIVNNWKV